VANNFDPPPGGRIAAIRLLRRSELPPEAQDELTEVGYAVTTLLRGEEAEPAVAQGQTDLVLCDLRLPGMSGMELLKRVTALPDPPAFLLITAFGTIPQAVEALKLGADDFLTKPLDLEHLRLRVARTLEHLRLRREIEGLRHRELPLDFHGFIGQSPAMRELYEQIRLMAKAGGAVLIESESGSGKELAAQAVHAESPRAEGPFVAVNTVCRRSRSCSSATPTTSSSRSAATSARPPAS
jgi:DNA-binding NtrC family response regulator